MDHGFAEWSAGFLLIVVGVVCWWCVGDFVCEIVPDAEGEGLFMEDGEDGEFTLCV